MRQFQCTTRFFVENERKIAENCEHETLATTANGIYELQLGNVRHLQFSPKKLRVRTTLLVVWLILQLLRLNILPFFFL